MSVTSVWEQWLVFNNTNVEQWVKTFLGRVEEDNEGKEEEVQEEVVEKPVERKGKWKSVTAKTEVDEKVVPSGGESVPLNALEDSDEEVDGRSMDESEDVDGKSMSEREEEEEDVDGEPMEENDVDGVPMDDDEDVDGEPMEEEDVDREPMEETISQAKTAQIAPSQMSPQPEKEISPPAREHPPSAEAPRPQKRQRMRAADMFND